MVQNGAKQRIVALIMLSLTAIIWGAGFVLTDDLLLKGFDKTPGLQNALRFGLGTIVLTILLRKHIKINKKTMLYSSVGGVLLFAGFMLQLIGQNYISPAHCGFFTALYFVITPFVAWIAYKKAPTPSVIIAVIVAVLGIVVLNLSSLPTSSDLLGGGLSILGALMFAVQIVWSDYLLKTNKVESNNLVVLQLVVASLLFVLYTLIFESKKYSTLTIDVSAVWWEILIVALLGTGFAYFAQTYAQNVVSPAQTSLILACETPIGAILSISLGIDEFSWSIVVGGLLIVASVFIIEIVPLMVEKYKSKLLQKFEDSNEQWQDQDVINK